MGAKSTVTLSRSDAVDMAVSKFQELGRKKLRRRFNTLSDEELEDILELMNDRLNNGHGLDNYQIDPSLER